LSLSPIVASAKERQEYAPAFPPPDQLAKILDPWRMTQPGIPEKE
jgi:hypothetical protein